MVTVFSVVIRCVDGNGKGDWRDVGIVKATWTSEKAAIKVVCSNPDMMQRIRDFVAGRPYSIILDIKRVVADGMEYWGPISDELMRFKLVPEPLPRQAKGSVYDLLLAEFIALNVPSARIDSDFPVSESSLRSRIEDYGKAPNVKVRTRGDKVYLVKIQERRPE